MSQYSSSQFLGSLALATASSVAMVGVGSFAHAGGRCSAGWDSAIGDPGAGDETLTLDGPEIHDAIVYDDGTGSALYVGGDFIEIGGVVCNGVAKWNGTSWSALGSGMDQRVTALAIFDDGSGPALFAAGYFVHADGNEVNHIAKWNGSEWVDIGADVPETEDILCMHVWDDGSGPALFIGGGFTTIGGIQANSVAKWDGTTWSTFGLGVEEGLVYAMTDFDDGSGPALYVGGSFNVVDDETVYAFAKWNGTAWVDINAIISNPTKSVHALAVMPGDTGPVLAIGGRFDHFNNVANTEDFAIWDGKSISALSEDTFEDEVRAIEYFDDGNGAALYVGGQFTHIGALQVRKVAKWDGKQWAALANGVGPTGAAVGELCAYDDGSGPRLVVAGRFLTASGATARLIAIWGCVIEVDPCIADSVDSKTLMPPGDGVTDGADLAYLLGEWGHNPGSLADIVTSKTFQPPPDGIVDGADLAVLLGAWGPCS